MTRLVLLGGGHAHLFVLERLAQLRPPGLDITLVTPYARQIYSGMLPGWIAGAYSLDECAVPLDRLAARAGVRLVLQSCVALDIDRGRVVCADGQSLPFDLLSLDVGSATADHGIEGAARATSVRPIERFVEAVPRWLHAAQSGGLRDIVLVGGGAAATEIGFALDARLAAMGRRGPGGTSLTLSGADKWPLSGLPTLSRRWVLALMRDRGIRWEGGQPARAVTEAGVVLADGRTLPATEILLATGARAHPWLAASGLATDGQGYVRVARTLQSLSHPQIFAAGDCAAYVDSRPKSGVFAVRAGPQLAANLLRAAAGEALQEWRPQARALYLLDTSDGKAIGAWGAFAWRGRWVRRWKDRIDRGFTQRFAGPAGTAR